MLEKANEIVMLIQKHTSDELSPEERKALEDWINQTPENKLVFEELSNADSFTSGMIEYHNIINIAKEKRLSSDRNKVVQLYARRAPWRLYMVAAAIIFIIFIAGTLFVMTRQENKEISKTTPTTAAPYEIPPAGNKAVLTLSNGKAIVLSGAGNGILAQDGKTVINKTQDGELVYKANRTSANPSLIYNTISTPRGGKYQVALPDGSKVWLNAATVLRFPVAFSGKERQVELSGEAYFEVAKDATKPFKVTVNAGSGTLQEIEVLGTHFNVGAYPEESITNTTLLEGSIKVTSGSKSENTFSRKLLPGQRVIVSRSSREFTVTTPEDPESSIAWVNGKFSFEKFDLASVMRELARWYDVDVQFQGTGQNSQLISGDIERTIPLSKLLSNLERMVPVRFSVEGRTITVKP